MVFQSGRGNEVGFRALSSVMGGGKVFGVLVCGQRGFFRWRLHHNRRDRGRWIQGRLRHAGRHFHALENLAGFGIDMAAIALLTNS